MDAPIPAALVDNGLLEQRPSPRSHLRDRSIDPSARVALTRRRQGLLPSGRSPRLRRRALLRGSRTVALVLTFGLAIAACGDFTATSQPYTVQPSLTAAEVTPVVPQQLPASTTPGSSPPSSATPNSTSPPATTPPADPCAPTDPIVVAACLAAPWGLAPLPDGISALVGERTTGRILKVVSGSKPVLVTTVGGINAKGDGGLLGIAISPSYSEDGLIYAYVTTATDNRVIRIAPGEKPKAILTGIPRATTGNGGAIAFTADSVLYVGTGNLGSAKPAAATSLAGKLLRIDEFGKPAVGNPKPTSPIFSAGFNQVTGLCRLPTGAMAALDHRTAADVLLPAKSGKDFTTLRSGDAVWTWKTGDGGAADCATSSGLLINSSLGKQQLTGIAMSATGSFSGSTRVLLAKTYGRLLTVQSGAKNAVWLTTSNKDGKGKPVAADDRVLLIPDVSSSGGDGPD
ncbi:hypothetical protein ABIB25_000803 [Nakamurella sp. UYEF19]|uniref:PQQ-dependent sugar dehydrogenase n=1 Tax=Nakamurella sp. UYEF19 TaxID=1756392 RepID=UPI003393C360